MWSPWSRRLARSTTAPRRSAMTSRPAAGVWRSGRRLEVSPPRLYMHMLLLFVVARLRAPGSPAAAGRDGRLGDHNGPPAPARASLDAVGEVADRSLARPSA